MDDRKRNFICVMLFPAELIFSLVHGRLYKYVVFILSYTKNFNLSLMHDQHRAKRGGGAK